jgi:hypothetical protein
MKRVGTVAVSVALVVLASCGSSGGKSHSAPTHGTNTTSTTAASTTTTLPPPVTVPLPTTTTIGVMEYARADVAVDTTAKALGLTLSPDVRQCALVAWIQRASQTERDAMLAASLRNPMTEDESRRHLAGAFAECLPASDVHTAVVALITASRLKNGECVATRFATYRLAPESVYLGLLIGFGAVSATANSEFTAAMRWCGA